MKISRRSALKGAAALGGAGLVVSESVDAAAAAGRVKAVPDFSDPLTLLRTHVKMVGTLGK
ncbi:MAG: hypothetical protein EBR15_07065, partial [Gammaproteobacteria bacterium]|nr:hypothetical protein [Gammaproteobacteria bacterium]